jgi:hypothetical protein
MGAVQGVSISEPPNDGTLTTLIDSHYGNYSSAPGGASSNGPQVQCTGVVAAEVQSCATALTCNVAISINGTASGIGATAAYASGSLWTSGLGTNPVTCGAKSHSTGGGSSGEGCCGGGEICSGDGIQSQAGSITVCDPSTCGCEFASPIIIDTNGHGFHLTSLQDGVTFDILNTGIPIKIAWTTAASGNAFLALDRNHNGRIDNGGELFGNHTQQPSSANPNGFLALEEFDKPENGGNGDGIIDWHDAVYSKLLLWIDENHDGISQPEELHTLPELGVFSISLTYREEPFTDQYGNWFHYRSAVNPDPLDGESKDGRLTYDVFFVGLRTAANTSLDRIISKGDRSLR